MYVNLSLHSDGCQSLAEISFLYSGRRHSASSSPDIGRSLLLPLLSDERRTS